MHLFRLILAFGVAVASTYCQETGVNYRLVPEWPTQAKSAAGAPAGPWNFIQVPAVAITPGGNVLVLHRGAHPIMEFESSGKFVRSWGDGLISEGKVVAVNPRDRAP